MKFVCGLLIVLSLIGCKTEKKYQDRYEVKDIHVNEADKECIDRGNLRKIIRVIDTSISGVNGSIDTLATVWFTCNDNTSWQLAFHYEIVD
jgi:hypothetical protein